MHSLRLSHRIRWLFGGAYVLGIIWVYRERGFDHIDEVLRISIADYVLVVILALILELGILIYNLCRGQTRFRD